MGPVHWARHVHRRRVCAPSRSASSLAPCNTDLADPDQRSDADFFADLLLTLFPAPAADNLPAQPAGRPAVLTGWQAGGTLLLGRGEATLADRGKVAAVVRLAPPEGHHSRVGSGGMLGFDPFMDPLMGGGGPPSPGGGEQELVVEVDRIEISFLFERVHRFALAGCAPTDGGRCGQPACPCAPPPPPPPPSLRCQAPSLESRRSLKRVSQEGLSRGSLKRDSQEGAHFPGAAVG